jgi:peptidoglycan/LPS O-acetylase OafA/YrhL
VLIGCVAASLGLRVFLTRACGLYQDPWVNRFFPTELALFLAGALAYRIYRWLRDAGPSRVVAWGVGATYVMVLLVYQFCPAPPGLGTTCKLWAFHAISWLALPWLFLGTARSRLDRYVGDLSYPVYLVHWPVIIVFLTPAKAGGHARPFLDSLTVYPGSLFTSWSALLIVLTSIATAAVLHHGVCVRIERLRQARVRPATVSMATHRTGILTSAA